MSNIMITNSFVRFKIVLNSLAVIAEKLCLVYSRNHMDFGDKDPSNFSSLYITTQGANLDSRQNFFH